MNIFQPKISFYLSGLLLFILAISSCKEDSLFKGKQAYAIKASGITVDPGIGRAKLTLTLEDPTIVSAKIYWDNRKSVKEITVNRTGGTNIYSTILENLPEGDYTFEIITVDANGNTSAPVTVSGKVYGSTFSQSLQTTPITDIIFENGSAIITWGTAIQGALHTEVKYTDASNAIITVKVLPTETITTLTNFKPGTVDAFFQYCTLYKPNVQLLDTLRSTYQTAAVITGTLKAIAASKNITLACRFFYGYGGNNHGVINDGSPNHIYSTIAENEFTSGQVYWGATRWAQSGASDFNDFNGTVNWIKQKNQKAMMQLLVGPDNYLPTWFTTGTFTPTEMDAMLKNLVNEIMTSNDNKTKVESWNVANEVFNTDGTYRTMKWNDLGWEDDASGLTGVDKVNKKHPIFIGKAFQYCREKTNAKLELRDYGIEFNSPSSDYYFKHKAYYQLLKHMQAKGYPIDAVGIQAHRTIGEETPATYEIFTNTIKRFKSLGLDVYITELDISSAKINAQTLPWTPALAAQQKADYYNTVKAAVAGGVNSISVWGFRDNNDPSWKVNQNPCIFDESYNRKPAYYGVQKALYEIKK